MPLTSRAELTEMPKGMVEKIKNKYHVTPDKLRISYIGGPADVVGTFNYWFQGQHDPRVPCATYSSLFYDVVDSLDCKLQVFTQFDTKVEHTHQNIIFQKVDRDSFSGTFQYYISQIKFALRVKKYLEEFQPHIFVICDDLPAFTFPLFASKGRDIILSAHNTYWPMNSKREDLKSRIKNYFVKLFLTKIDNAVCVSHECMRQISDLTNGRVKALVSHPNILKEFDWSPPKKIRNLLFLGRVEENKGIFLLLEAFKRLTKKYDDINLVFAGSGSDEQRLEQAIKDSRLENVTFVGRLDSDAVHSTISKSDLMLCPTKTDFNEGLAMICFEGAAHGVPTLMSSVVPAADLLDKACVVFEADSEKSLENKLEGLIKSDDKVESLCNELEKVRPNLYRKDLNWGAKICEALIN